jgi:hypothetical protein
MGKFSIVVIAVGSVGAGLAACAERRPIESPSTLRSRSVHEDFDARLRQIALEYKNWTRVSDQAQWAPASCLPPRARSGIQMSASDAFGSHGRKLYYLFAQDWKGYMQATGLETKADTFGRNPAGQAVVKESWFAEPVTGAMVPFAGYGMERQNSDTAKGADGQKYRAGAKGDLFIMFKVDPLTPGTDNGWVYGTTTPDGSVVTSVGRVQSCMNCHVQAPYDRLFGAK